MDAFNHISTEIDAIYKQLTKDSGHPIGGTAYLSLESDDSFGLLREGSAKENLKGLEAWKRGKVGSTSKTRLKVTGTTEEYQGHSSLFGKDLARFSHEFANHVVKKVMCLVSLAGVLTSFK
jgi:hypothetical protein